MMLHCSIDTHRLTGMKNRCQRPRTGEESGFSKCLLLLNIALISLSRITIKAFILPPDVFLLHAFVPFPLLNFYCPLFNIHIHNSMFQCLCPDCPQKEVIFSKEHLFMAWSVALALVRPNKQTSVYLLPCSRCQKLYLLPVYLQNTHVLMPHSNNHRSSFSIELLKLHQPTENNGFYWI